MRGFLNAVLCLVLLLSLSGCGLYDLLGIDTHDYGSENSIATVNQSGELAGEAARMICIMVQNTPYLKPFDNPADAAEFYRNGILCSILERNYAKYNANIELIERTRELYPTYEITTVIPAVDFESTAYRYFGGTASVGNSSTDLFTYLEKIDAYVSVGIGVDSSAKIEFSEFYETENTYVCVFTSSMNETVAGPYRLVMMKRDDGTFYMRSLEEVK
ncbi:MAG: hypothetical protein IKU61_05025 [Clostridia bacterium]|nr:hypothetical protein [Clostridia bacterium]